MPEQSLSDEELMHACSQVGNPDVDELIVRYDRALDKLKWYRAHDEDMPQHMGEIRAMTATSSPVRIAMRVEGHYWVAYLAMRDTMKHAMEIGRCPMKCVRFPEAKAAFIAYGQAFLQAWVAEQGLETQRFETISAPEHERSGNA